MKKIVLVTAIILLVCVGCDSNEEKIVKCTKKEKNVTKIVTITKKNDKIIVRKEDNKEECYGEICDYGSTVEEERVEDFDEAVDTYKKEGYTCERKK